MVIELKRTHDGGHLELQALRYAAMVSTMTFDDLVSIYRRHLHATDQDEHDPEPRLRAWIDDAEDGAEPILHREVRIILVSSGFGKEITTTVLWLNDLFGLDIQCVRITPYRLDERLLLDVQPVIPLPEAAELTVQLRRREKAAKASSAGGKDYTRFIVTTPDGTTELLAKRQAIRALVIGLHAAGVDTDALAATLPNAKFLSVEGDLEGDELIEAFIDAYPSAERNLKRWFLDTPIHENGRTWVFSKVWGIQSADVLAELGELAPSPGFAVVADG